MSKCTYSSRSLRERERESARYTAFILFLAREREREKTRALLHRALTSARSTSRWTMEVTWNHYYGTVHKLSLLTGIWPFLNARAKFFRLGVLTATMLSIFVPQVNLLTREISKISWRKINDTFPDCASIYVRAGPAVRLRVDDVVPVDERRRVESVHVRCEHS